MANIVRDLAPAALPASAVLGEPLTLQPRTGAATIRVTAPDGASTDIPVTLSSGGSPDPAIYSQTGQAGEYTGARSSTIMVSRRIGRFRGQCRAPVESNLTANPDLPSVLATGSAVS